MDAAAPATTTPSLRSLLSLAWPIVLSRATQSVMGFFDALMVAPLGEESLAAVTTGALNTFAFIIMPMGTVFILQSFAAQLRGRGDAAALPRYAWYGLLLAVVFGALSLLFVPLVRPALGLFDYAPGVHDIMSTYVAIRLVSVGAVVATEALGNWYGGLGNTRIGMVAAIVSMVFDLAGNFLLIQPRFGLPGYGVEGAAWGSTVASFIGFGIIAFPFFRGMGYERIKGKLELRLREFLRVLRFGLPNGVNWFFEFAALILFINVVVAHLGTTELAAFNVVMQVNSISFMPAFGLSSAGAILVGDAIGRREHDQVWPIVKLTGAVAMGWMASVGLLYVIFPHQLIGLFEPKDGNVALLLSTGVTMLMLSALWQLFDAITLTLSEALRAAGDTAWCMTARLVLAWAVFTPAAWIAVLWLDGGVLSLMSALIAYIGLLAATLGFRFFSGRWRNIDLVGAEPTLV
jgi:MATE family multidrug resistance protein